MRKRLSTLRLIIKKLIGEPESYDTFLIRRIVFLVQSLGYDLGYEFHITDNSVSCRILAEDLHFLLFEDTYRLTFLDCSDDDHLQKVLLDAAAVLTNLQEKFNLKLETASLIAALVFGLPECNQDLADRIEEFIERTYNESVSTFKTSITTVVTAQEVTYDDV